MDSDQHGKPASPVGIKHDAGIFVRGLAMGAADVVPGVSGGTVALVTGIYARLIGSISRFDSQFLGALTARQFSRAADHVDLRFLVALAAGIGCGFIATVRLLTGALENDEVRPLIFAAFNGMIFAATWIVIGMIRRLDNQNTTLNVMSGVIGVGIAAIISIMNPTSAGTAPDYWYLFVCGIFGICAMILPGISGALILILLGAYQFLVSVAKEILSFQNLGSNLLVVLCFGLGAVTGLLSFSRVLSRLLTHRPGPTLALLCGLMLGSLPKLWPFQFNATADIEDFKLRRYEATYPESASQVFFCLASLIIAAVVIIAIEEMTRRAARRHDSSAA